MDKLYKEIYSEIENAIIRWSIDGTKTAGSLTREIIEIYNTFNIEESFDDLA